MGCCGQRRAAVSSAPRPTQTVTRTVKPARPIASDGTVYEYTGTTGMTVYGRASQRTYRFSQRGARVQIDPRDVPSLGGLPNLRRV
jgi:hypothetical protein